jgi:starch-binding outer membrane protein, SusD/RagB family
MKIVSKNPLLVGTALLTLATGALYGCKDFLGNAASPQGTLDQSTLANPSGVEGTLIGAYRTLDCTDALGAWGCAASNWVFGSVASDDSYKGSNATDQPPINDIEGYHWGTADADSYLAQKWQTVYEGVVRSNSTLRLLKQVVASTPGAFSAATANGIAGEAIFLRAHYHFEAWRMWGNIPYYREDETDFRKANESSALAVTDILKDLDSAIKLLPLTPRNGEKARATQWTAKAYKGRVQVYAGQYAAGLTTLQDVKTNGPYGLETSFDKVWTGFQAFANGRETIWAFQASANDGEPTGANANVGERLNFPYSGSHFGCCGFNQPTQNLVNFYQVDANGLPLALSSPGTWNASDADFVGGPTNLTAVDPRLDYTVGRDGVPYKDWGLYASVNSAGGWVRDLGNGGPYSPKKNVEEQGSNAESKVGWQNTQLNSVNIHLYRYADLLLLLAEAQVETGDLAGATANVNLVRARAGVTAQGCGKGSDVPTQAALVAAYPLCGSDSRIAVPLNCDASATCTPDPTIKWAVYKVGQYPTFPSQAYGREAVRTERRLELAMEGQRFFDLRRWGLAYAAAAINNYINGEGGGAEKSAARRLYLAGAEPFIARHLLYPIPSLQLSLSTVGTQKMLAQNPGW